MTTFALAHKERHHLPNPYTSACIPDWKDTELYIPRNMGIVLEGMDYDETYCSDICQLEAAWAMCGCLWRDKDPINFIDWADFSWMSIRLVDDNKGFIIIISVMTLSFICLILHLKSPS